MSQMDYEAEIELTREAVADRLQALGADFAESEEITVAGEEMTVTIPAPAGTVEYEVEIEREGNGEVELELELEWAVGVDTDPAADTEPVTSSQRIDPEDSATGSEENASDSQFR